jgi:hypothetical protein
MGFSYASDDSPKMCFNAAKSWQLGFYADKSTTVSPLVSPSWTGKLVGIVDYENAGNDHVIVKLETGSYLDYYMNFNRQASFNSETQEGGDQVLLMTQGAEGQAFAKSTLLAKLSEGQAYEIEDFGGVTSYPVQVRVDKIDTSVSPGYALVSITGSAQPSTSVYLNCGDSDYDDGTNTWKTDSTYVNIEASSYITGAAIDDSPVERQRIYQSERYDANLAYRIPLERGHYDVFLHFSEIYFDRIGSRVFNVMLEGSVMFQDVDVFRDTGARNRALVKSAMGIAVNDGSLDIQFIKLQQNPKVRQN